nr:winged helix-turn-helix domain-containing protein [Halococcoides cellulosivorans]
MTKLSDIEPVAQLQALMTEYGHVDFPQLVAGSGLRLLYYLDRRRTATELAEVSDLSRATVYRRLNDLQAVGIIGKSKSHYELNDPFSKLSSIARGLAHHEHRREAERRADRVNILWETHEEYLFASDSELDRDGFFLTGPSLFAEFDIPLLTRNRRHYFHSDRITGVSSADLVCHTLLIDDDSRYRTYCLLLIQRETIGWTTLRERAKYYEQEADIDLLTIITDLVAYLETGGRIPSDRLPSWEDFKSTAADYEINV